MVFDLCISHKNNNNNTPVKTTTTLTHLDGIQPDRERRQLVLYLVERRVAALPEQRDDRQSVLEGSMDYGRSVCDRQSVLRRKGYGKDQFQIVRQLVLWRNMRLR